MTKKMFTLRTKLFMAFFLLSAIITLAISFRLFVHMRNDHFNTLKRDLAVIVSLTIGQSKERLISGVIAGDQNASNRATEELLQRLMGENLSIDRVTVWQVSNSGKYIYLADSSNLQHQKSDTTNVVVPPSNLPPDMIVKPVVVEVPDSNYELIVYAPLKDDADATIALIGFIIDGAAVGDDVRHFVIQVANIAIVAIIIVGIISWWLARGFAWRLSQLNTAINEITAGNMDIKLSDKGQDEVAVLARQINRLAATLSSEREEMLLSAIESLVTALEAKDTYTYGHSSQVSSMSYAIAKQVGMSEQEIFNVRIAALLHDIGKIGVPDKILNKPGRLDTEERLIIEKHPEIGSRILVGIPALINVTEIVRHHHERWDGKGYPDALAGKTIPLGARIIAIADTYQAMTSDRPYRKGMATTNAMAEIRRCAGSQFDPTLVSVFLEAWKDC